MTSPATTFTPLARALHWLMAALILAMLFMGAGMASTVTPTRLWLLALHKPLGAAILVLAVARLVVRWRHPPPALPSGMGGAQRFAAKASHGLLYALMLAMPLLGWGMLSAAGDPIKLGASLQLPAVLPADPSLFALLRRAHAWLAWLLFATILLHVAAALYHGLIRRDGVFESMARGARTAPSDRD